MGFRDRVREQTRDKMLAKVTTAADRALAAGATEDQVRTAVDLAALLRKQEGR